MEERLFPSNPSDPSIPTHYVWLNQAKSQSHAAPDPG